ncbi:riboflavin kinase [Spiroplasma taiwanense]|uniref:riboflavin kinase n=1 Tax=Spiroplasma taiwanense CT-1 TaxID=1276220 RepID=S5MHB3_9MOLU|nr:riboflavin kinase [Spiroplasma taiwanense]AGR41230.1 riboflavin kinase/FAD synthetase [Spiroplasma taiwanense CT-1]
MVQSFFYNNMTLIMVHLKPSIGLITDFENWNEFEDNQIKELKAKAKEQNLQSTLFVLVKDELNFGLWNQENLIKKANEVDIDLILFYFINPMFNLMTEQQLFDNISNFLSIEKIMIAEDFKSEIEPKFTTKFIKDNWKENALIVGNFKEKKECKELISLIKNSDFNEFKKKTNFYYQFTGRVSIGKQLGRQIGFPTINLITPQKILVEPGVYVCDVYIDHLKKHFLGAGCYWTNELNQLVFETNIIDFDQEIYGWKVVITPFKKLRENVKVNDLEELKEMLALDIENTKKIEMLKF